MKTKITIILALFLSFYSFAQVGTIFTTDGINYKITTEATVEVAENSEITGAVIIPESVTYNSINYQVDSIGTSAFSGCTSLNAITIPNSVLSIRTSSFSGCTSLNAVTIPSSVIGVFPSAFSGCTSLKSINLPNSVTGIGQNAFENCKNLTYINIPNPITSIAESTFSGCISLTSVNMSKSVVTNIGKSAFSDCSNLTSVNLPNSVTNIRERAFYNCTSLKSVTLPYNVFRIELLAFYNCTSLNSVTVNWSTPLSIFGGTFGVTSYLPNITLYVPTGTATGYKAANVWKEFGTITEYVAPVVGQKMIANGVNYTVTKATLPYEVEVGTNNTSNSGRFTSAAQTGISGALIIPDNVNEGGSSFSVTSIVASAFQNSTGLTSVTIPSSVTSIGDFAFSNCTGLTAVTVNGTTPPVINNNVFENITLANVTLNVPAGETTVYDAANVWKDFKVEITLGTNSFSTNNALPFYPNPAQSRINFSEEINNLEVFDITGKKVKSFQNSSSNFDVSNLTKGIYLLKGKTAEGKSSSQKMVKQ